jgi:predicted RNase H-like nuclease
MMVPVAGVDGCRSGWVVVHDGHAAVRASFIDVLDPLPGDTVVAVDIPIGLADRYEVGGRECDRLARARLGRGRGTSVFPAPPRPALAARTLAAARALGWPATKQGLNIAEKIEQVDRVMTPSLQARVVEVHPELSFAAMNGDCPVLEPKRSPSGSKRRRALLRRAGVVVPGRPRDAAFDDLLDACALSWSARRFSDGIASCVSGTPTCDARGLRMEIRW